MGRFRTGHIGSLRDNWDRVVYCAIAGLVLANAWWIQRHRSGGGLEHDEARILPLAFLIRSQFRLHDPLSFPRTWANWATIGPLLSTLAAPLVSETPGQSYIWYLELPFLAVLLVSTYMLARELAGRFAATVSVAVVALVPGTVWFSRTFQQIVPGTALWVLAVLCAVKSDRLRSRAWSVGLGVSVGIGLLTRTMLLGFVPYLAMALAVQIACLGRGERPSPRRILEATAPAVLIASTWWLPQWRNTWGYLSSAGLSGGPDISVQSLVSHELDQIELLLTPLLMAALVGLFAISLVGVMRASVNDFRGPVEWMIGLISSGESIVIGGLLWGFILLSVSPNNFPGFELLNVPLLVVLACVIFRHRPGRILALPLLILMVPLASVYLRSDQSWYSQISMMLYKPEATVVEESANPAEFGSDWQLSANENLKWLHEYSAERSQSPNILMVNNRSLYGNNQYGIARYILGYSWEPKYGWDQSKLNTWNVEDALTTEDLKSGDNDAVNFVILIDPGVGMLRPQAKDSSSALQRSGFEIVRQSELPDGSLEHVWWRRTSRN